MHDSKLEAGDRGRSRSLARAAVTIIAFTIIGELVSMKNSRQIVTMGGKPALIKSADAREYERTALLQIPAVAKVQLTGPVRVTIRAFYASERKDLDCALLLDVLADRYEKRKGKLQKLGEGQYGYGPGERVLVQKGVFCNDRQCRELHFYHFIDRANPRSEVEVEPMQPQQPSLLEDVPLLHTVGSPDPF